MAAATRRSARRRPTRRRPACRRRALRRPVRRLQTRKRKQTDRKKRLRSVHNYLRQKRSLRVNSKVATKLPAFKVRMTKDAWGMLNSYVDGIYRRVSGEAERLRRKDRRSSIISSDVQSALKQVMARKHNRRAMYSKTR